MQLLLEWLHQSFQLIKEKIIFWGIGGAVILRIILTLLTAYLLQITGLRLIGGFIIIIYCLQTLC